MNSAVLGFWEHSHFIHVEERHCCEITVRESEEGKKRNASHLFESIAEVMKLGIKMMDSTKDCATPTMKSPVMDLIVSGLNKRKVGLPLDNEQVRMTKV